MDATPSAIAASPAPGHVTAPRKLRLGCILALCFCAAVVLGIVGIAAAAYRTLGLGSDARALRDAVRQNFTVDDDWQTRVEVRAGPVICAVLRAVASAQVDEPDARLALRALRAAEVGVYDVDFGAEPDGGRFLRRVTDAMQTRGWTRIVGVIDRSAIVAVFVPRRTRSERDVAACVLVRNAENLVIARVRADLVRLLTLVERHAGDFRGPRPAN